MAGAGPAGLGLHQQPRHCQPLGRHHLQVTILLDILFGTMGMFEVACRRNLWRYTYDFMTTVHIFRCSFAVSSCYFIGGTTTNTLGR